MSYCRWSSDYGECDVYVYEDVHGGWTTHVAGRRVKHKLPQSIRDMYPSHGDDNWIEKYMAASDAQEVWRRQFPGEMFPTVDTDGNPGKGHWSLADSEYIDLSEISEYAGESFNDPTPEECADTLEGIRRSGLNVPQYAIDALREEATA